MKFQLFVLILAILSVVKTQVSDAEINLENINTDVQNINTGVLFNQSGVIVLNNVNFGVIFQQFGEFNFHVLSLAESISKATGNDAELASAKIVLEDIATQVQNINSGIVLNQSGIVVISNSNFGLLIQQFGSFYNEAKQAIRKLRGVEANNVSIADGETNTQNINTGIVLNESGIVEISNANFGTIFQQFGKFTQQTVDTITEAIAPENNGVAGIELNDIATVVQNINSGIALNQSGIVVIDNSNFGTVIQQFGDINSDAFPKFAEQEQQQQVRGSEQNATEVDASIDISNVNTIVQNIDSAFALNQSGIIVLNNVNFGVLFQEIGNFNINIKQIQEKADRLEQLNYANQSNLTKKFLRKYVRE